MELYADGTFIFNPRRGGYGWVLSDGSWGQGWCDAGRSHQMELLAIVKGLESLSDGVRVEAYTDCLYVFLGAKRRRDTSPLWLDFLAHKERLLLDVIKIAHHPSHKRAHDLAREAAFNGVSACWLYQNLPQRSVPA